MAYRFVEGEKFGRRITILSNSGVKVSTLVKISFQFPGALFSNIDTKPNIWLLTEENNQGQDKAGLGKY